MLNFAPVSSPPPAPGRTRLRIPIQWQREAQLVFRFNGGGDAPAGDGQLATALSQSAVCKEYEEAFGHATGLRLSFRMPGCGQHPHEGQRPQNRFCGLLAGDSRACAACLSFQARLRLESPANSRILTCPFGLVEIAVPVRLGRRTLGFLQLDPVLSNPPDDARFGQVAARIQSLGAAIPARELRRAYFSLPVVPGPKLAAAARLLESFAEHLAMRSNQIALQLGRTEPAVIVRAKQFIEQHYQEKLSLDAVAKAVNTDRYYLCKLFKKLTGLTFTAYLSRMRIEVARNLLLNPNLRISEIAFEVGFQSLTHFNLVFKRILGESPSSYRSHLPVVQSGNQFSFPPARQAPGRAEDNRPSGADPGNRPPPFALRRALTSRARI